MPEADQFGFLQKAQQDGKVRHLGLSEATVEQIERAGTYFTVVSVQNRFNLADREWESVLDHCERENIAFIPWFPLQIGTLEGSPALIRIADAHGATPSQIALAWLLHRSAVMLPIPGTSRVTHLEENVAAAGLKLTGEDVDALSKAV